MANSRFEYVRAFEQPDSILLNTWIIVRIDGRGFHKFSNKYGFVKPNDKKALDLMNEAGVRVMEEIPDLILAYGQSDEYSFVFHKSCSLFERRGYKLTTMIVSIFSAAYVINWHKHFPDVPLSKPYPNFDGRPIPYPSVENLKDYLNWRQTDCHINNLYNTTFWTLVNKGSLSTREAEEQLKGTLSSDKHEILFSRFSINYNNELEMFRKGSVLLRERDEKGKVVVRIGHHDLIKEKFWAERPWIFIGNGPPKKRLEDHDVLQT